MTIIEQMAEATWNSNNPGHKWDKVPMATRAAFEQDLRRGLAVLAECDISKQMIDLGYEDDFSARQFETNFHTLIRALIEEGTP